MPNLGNIDVPKFASYKPKIENQNEEQSRNGVSDIKIKHHINGTKERHARRSNASENVCPSKSDALPDQRTLDIPKFTSYRIKTEDKCSNVNHARGNDERTEFHPKRIKDKHIGSSSGYLDGTSKQSSSQQSDLAENLSDNFVIDKKGDEKNLTYGSLHKYSVPKYYLFGAGQVLGASTNMRINRELGDDKWIVLTHTGPHKIHGREKYIFSKIERQKPRLLKVCPKAPINNHAPAELDFISLHSYRKIDKLNQENGESCSDGNIDYLNLDLLTSSGNDMNFRLDLEDESDNEPSDSNNEQYMEFDSSVRKKNAILCRKVEETPLDVEAWVSVINHQDSLIRTSDDPRQVTQAMVKSTAEVKIHLYEKALGYSHSLENRERLLLGLMSEGEKIWELKTQANRWELITRENIDSQALWSKYLEFKQTTLSIFRYEEVKKVYLQRIQLLTEALKFKPENADRYYHQLIYVLLRATLFIHQAGYMELAVGIWQGILEINFCGPTEKYMQGSTVDILREFWESEIPRIGEDGAKGWRHYLSFQEIHGPTYPSMDKTGDSFDKTKLFRSWAAAERLRSKSSRIPAKTLDEVVEDDPFRVIFFTDIRDFLYSLPPESKILHRSCINAFLVFCRLTPLVNIDDEWNERFDDQFIAEGLLGSELSWLEGNHLSKEESSENAILETSFPIKNFVYSPESLFYKITELHGGPKPYIDRFPEDNGPVLYSFIRNSLELLINNWYDDSLAEYYLSFKYVNEPDSIKRISKNLLKQNPTSFRLYHAYALIEWSRGNKEVAQGVFSSALNISKSSKQSCSNDALIMLWKSWIWTCIEQKSYLTALKYIVCIADGTPSLSFDISPALVLRAKNYLTSKRDFLLSNNAVIAVMYTEYQDSLTQSGLAILEYLSCNPDQELLQETQRDIISSYNIFSSTSQIMQERQLEKSNELLLQSACRLFFHHCQREPYRPALIREYLTDFLQKFPKNTIFLSFYSWNESRLRIENRVRTMLLNTILTPQHDTLTSRIFSIQHEIKVGTVHSVKAAFEHSVASPVTRYSAGLWRFYILYCLGTPALKHQAKSVWYRALRACSWMKELYILGFEKLEESIDFAELKRTWKIMDEKELRVHVDLLDEFDDYESLKS